MSIKQERNKEAVRKLLDAAFNKKNPVVAGEFVTEGYIQHNPMVPTGKEGLLSALPGFYKALPTLKWQPKHIWADGDYVKDTAVVDIFRFEGDKIAEHWDVVQEIPARMAHKNGMF
jgi:predicted SnoaL-like aldol condensation-catalyzing enzyme